MAPLLQMQTQVEDMALSKVLEYNIAQTEETVKSAIEDAKDGAGQINLVKVYIPWALLIVGALILIIGLLIGGGQAPPQPSEE